MDGSEGSPNNDALRMRGAIGREHKVGKIDAHRRFMAPLAVWAQSLNGRPISTRKLTELVRLCARVSQGGEDVLSKSDAMNSFTVAASKHASAEGRIEALEHALKLAADRLDYAADRIEAVGVVLSIRAWAVEARSVRNVDV